MKGRVLGIDPGTKRIGLAVSDPLGITAQGIDTFVVSSDGGDFLDYLSEIIERYGVEEIVVGMPISMSGGEIEGTVRARELAEKIRDRFKLAVFLRDERMTSLEAERFMRESGGKKGDIDRLAAVFILQTFLDEKGSGGA